MSISKRQVASYFLLPQFMPRLRHLFASGFSYVAFSMAQVYRTARLLPPNHPYLLSANIGRYGIGHVITEATNNLKFKKENIDQIIIYFMILIAIMLLFIQCFILGVGIVMPVAEAAGLPTNFAGWFSTPVANRQHDVAFRLMDRVFGLDDSPTSGDFFGSCVALGVKCMGSELPDNHLQNYPYPFHFALRRMFQVYSTGLLVIGVLIFLYFVVVVIAETAQEGTPFGRRFNHVWAPLRMVAALGLLVPIAQGLNSSQWILMYAAKWGSGFATNGWNRFIDTAAPSGSNETISTKPREKMVAIPTAPPLDALLEFGTVLATCLETYHRQAGNPLLDWIVYPYFINTDASPDQYRSAIFSTFDDILTWSNNGDIRLVYGRPSSSEEAEKTGGIEPLCGEVRLNVHDAEWLEPGVGAPSTHGSYILHEQYFRLMRGLWEDAAVGTLLFGGGWVGFNTWGDRINNRYYSRGPGLGDTQSKDELTSEELRNGLNIYQDYIKTAIIAAHQAQNQNNEWALTLRQLGWAGAAIWYNKIAQLNGAFIGGAYNLPTVASYPAIMEETKKAREKHDSNIDVKHRFRPQHSDGTPVELKDKHTEEMSKVFYEAQQLWGATYSPIEPSNNIYVDVINTIFGTEGLLDIHENINEGIHPLATLTAIGKSLIESSIANLGRAAGAGVGGGIFHAIGANSIGGFFSMASSFMLQVAVMGLTIGFVLYYVIPFLPFIYFFFAVGGWIKGIFEAMVGLPLWALAHIRIDGEGFAGDAASQGYYLLLEIFLRPILTIFGLIGSILILTAQVEVLNEIWYLVTTNVAGVTDDGITGAKTGSDRFMRGPVDQFFFTVIFAIICYMLAMAAFKLVDLIPNHILRWMGVSVSTFGEQNIDTAGNLVRNTQIGSQMVGGGLQQAASGGKEAAGALGGLAGKMAGGGGAKTP